MKRLQILALLIGGMTFVSAAHAEQVDNPQYAAWLKFSIGSSQSLDRTVDMGGQKVLTSESRTLKSITADAVTVDLRVTMTMNGMPMPPNSQPEVIKAKIESAQQPKQVGEETIDTAGKSFKCKVYAVTITSPRGTTSNAKLWICDAVPGGLVKTVVTTPHGDMTSMLTKFEAK